MIVYCVADALSVNVALAHGQNRLLVDIRPNLLRVLFVEVKARHQFKVFLLLVRIHFIF